jgi:uncharacterized protein YqeY
MTLFTQIKADQLAARKAKDGLKATLLTTLIGELTAIGKNDGNREVTDADVVKLVKKFLDGVNETIVLIKDVSNTDGSVDRYTNLLKEQSYLTVYMPRQMDEYALTIAVRIIINELGGGANMGQVMAALKTKHAGQYDGKMASNVVKQVL